MNNCNIKLKKKNNTAGERFVIQINRIDDAKRNSVINAAMRQKNCVHKIISNFNLT